MAVAGGRLFTGVCLPVFCRSVFLHDISKTVTAAIIKPDTEMFHRKSWKPIYFGIKRSKGKVTRHKNSAGVGLCIIVSAGFLRLMYVICGVVFRRFFENALVWLIVSFSECSATHHGSSSKGSTVSRA